MERRKNRGCFQKFLGAQVHRKIRVQRIANIAHVECVTLQRASYETTIARSVIVCGKCPIPACCISVDGNREVVAMMVEPKDDWFVAMSRAIECGSSTCSTNRERDWLPGLRRSGEVRLA